MDDLRINRRIVIPDSELRETFVRSGGPGGQHVNKVATKVELRWAPQASEALTDRDKQLLAERLGSQLTATGDLVVACSESRQQIRNREVAREMLAELVRAALSRPKKRVPTRPTRSSVARRIADKKRRGQIKSGRRGTRRSDDD